MRVCFGALSPCRYGLCTQPELGRHKEPRIGGFSLPRRSSKREGRHESAHLIITNLTQLTTTAGQNNADITFRVIEQTLSLPNVSSHKNLRRRRSSKTSSLASYSYRKRWGRPPSPVPSRDLRSNCCVSPKNSLGFVPTKQRKQREQREFKEVQGARDQKTPTQKKKKKVVGAQQVDRKSHDNTFSFTNSQFHTVNQPEQNQPD